MRAAIFFEQALAPVPGGTGWHSIELAAALPGAANPGDAVTSWTAWRRDLEPARVTGVTGPRCAPVPGRAISEVWG
jgi:hypothetical protein